ncbi:arylsulfatase [Kribbella sp. VKM Ac-2569]|uniref:arylsulfatase n=1 Tax=Kribbella sp. VKM Ac-2569 TaxID=2512220 RepID=UPI0010EE7371|nr:arylsulfatase [Kribbella sp. VKM Ac-2569]RZT27510.1 arylsulfatase [Kribbella sp. VKM Ac-2569]
MPQPNVIVIVADDLGYSDIGPFGGEIDTTSLQRLSDRGVRMSSYYVTPRCSPSRAALLTGRHPHSVGIGVLTTDNRPNGYAGSLRTDVPTLAEMLRGRGYATGLFGKWHLASEFSTPSDTWPTRRGFDEFRGILPGASSFFQPPLVEGEERVPDQVGDDFYFTDDISEHGADFVRRHAAQEEPFFLFLAYTAPHWPLHAREADIVKYRERFAAGWGPVRKERLRRLQEEGLVPGVDRLPDAQTAAEWPDQDTAWQVERMAVYAAQVEALDRGVGRVLDALDASGAAEDTMIVFLSDNGGCAEELPPEIPFLSEVVCPRTTPSGEEVVLGNDASVLPGPASTYQSYGPDWATVSNTPFRLWKRWVHEGGISTPFIASWPGGGVPRGGRISHSLGHVTDIVPTVMDALGAPNPGEGESLLEAWRNPETSGAERTVWWEHIGNAAIRRGRWKLVRAWGGPWELYDIEADRIESTDLSAEQPELVEELTAAYTEWAESHAVIPWQDVLDDYAARGIPVARAVG